MIMTFLLTGARLREIVHLDKGEIDLHQLPSRYYWGIKRVGPDRPAGERSGCEGGRAISCASLS